MKYKTDGPVITLYIYDMHGEHPIPKSTGVHIREHFNGHQCQEYLDKLNNPEGDSEIMLKNIFREYKKECWPTFDPVALDDADIPWGIIHAIHINKDWLNNWLIQYKIAIKEAMLNHGGDDDFYDYLPGFVDTYRQVCDYLDIPETFRITLREVIGSDDADNDWEDNGLYALAYPETESKE